MSILFINGSPNKNGNTAKLAAKLLGNKADTVIIGSPVYWHNMCGSIRNLIDRFYGSVSRGALKGCKLVFLFQGATLEGWMLEKAEYTMNHFAQIYGMDYVGMATNSNEAEKLSEEEVTVLDNAQEYMKMSVVFGDSKIAK